MNLCIRKGYLMNEFFDCPLSVKSLDEAGTFSGYASVFEVTDAQQETVARGAFTRSLKSWGEQGRMPKLLWQHDAQKPIGFWNELREDAHGLYVKGQLLLDVNQGREAYSLLKNGVIDGLSIGFIAVRARHAARTAPDKISRMASASRVRVLEEVNLQEISLVTFGANPHALVEQVKMDGQEFKSLMQQLDHLAKLLKSCP